MTMRTHLSVLAALVVLGASAPAFAQDVPADAGKALWCASAFTYVSPQARSQGQTAAADNFDKYAKTLNEMAAASLKKAGFADDKIKAQAATYTDKVGKELSGGGGAAEFSVVECTQLVDPAAAAAMPSAAPAPSTAAPAGGAMAPATPAPAAK